MAGHEATCLLESVLLSPLITISPEPEEGVDFSAWSRPGEPSISTCSGMVAPDQGTYYLRTSSEEP